jgi:hypothetical protein
MRLEMKCDRLHYNFGAPASRFLKQQNNLDGQDYDTVKFLHLSV